MPERDPLTDDARPEAVGPSGTADAADLLGEHIEGLIEQDAGADKLAPAIEQQEGPDAADSLELLDAQGSVEVVQEMGLEAAAEALAHMVPALALSVLADLSDDEVADLIGAMSPDDAADLLQQMPAERRGVLLALLPPRVAARLRRLALDDPESAGGIMTTEIAVVRSGLTVGQAIGFIKRNQAAEDQIDIYVVDEYKRLVGHVSMRDLLVHDDALPVADYLRTDTHVIPVTDDREEVAREFARYDLLTAPVVDPDHRVLGMITIDDVLDIIEAENAEDQLKQVGAGRDELVQSPLRKKLASRVPWLIVNLFTSQLAAAIILGFGDLIELIPVVAAVFPIIANESGNAGSQSFALTLRGLVSREVRAGVVRALLIREAAFGLIAGVFIGVLFGAGLAAMGAFGILETGSDAASPAADPVRLGAIAAVSMLVALWTGCLIGVTMPLLVQRLGFDPATASSIFLSMLTDAISFAAFLGMVFALKGWLMT